MRGAMDGRQPLALDAAMNRARRRWAIADDESRSRRWHNHPNPKYVTCFIEDYLGLPDRDERATEQAVRLEDAIQGFYASHTWRQIQEPDTRQWLAMDSDPYATTDVDGIDPATVCVTASRHSSVARNPLYGMPCEYPPLKRIRRFGQNDGSALLVNGPMPNAVYAV